jgi:eukaryotic-like serine/threonine-protein kinase
MGEVYRAFDTSLKRQVAIKVLPSFVSVGGEELPRFQREAEVLASLNHPHIAAVYGLETYEGGNALVMELVEGPTLADRIAHGPLPLIEALPIARQIAEALDAAHERGIVHRDLKPANVKVRDDGTVKVLDFGLAKLAGDRELAPGGDPSQSPTLLTRAPTFARGAEVARAGTILGTAAYMSPEQARGRGVDKRTDIWAFGAVLYEILTGRRAFPGDDVTETIAAIVTSTPDWSAFPAEVPPRIVTLVKRCLEKDRGARVGDIAVARFLLADDAALELDRAAPGGRAPRRGSLAALVWAAAVLAALAAGGVGSRLLFGPSSGAPAVTRLDMDLSPEALSPSTASTRPARTAIALAPDGRTLVFSGVRDGVVRLYARALDGGEPVAISGTEGTGGLGGQWPVFSPDGGWIGFVGDRKIKKVPVDGGPAATLCDLPDDAPAAPSRWPFRRIGRSASGSFCRTRFLAGTACCTR